MKKPLNSNLFDERVVERNIANGLITRDDYEKHLAKLPDDADNLDYSIITDDDDDDEDENDDDEDDDDDEDESDDSASDDDED